MAPAQQNSLGRGRYRSFAVETLVEEEGVALQVMDDGDGAQAHGHGSRAIYKAAFPAVLVCSLLLCAAIGAGTLWANDARRYAASSRRRSSTSDVIGLQVIPQSGAPQGSWQQPYSASPPAAGSWPPAALPTQIPGVPVQHPSLQWLDCEDNGGNAIVDATPYCTRQGNVAHHCVTVLHLSSGNTAMVELGGWCGHSVVTCRIWQEDGSTIDMHLDKDSSISGEEWWNQKDTLPASSSGRIGTYSPDGFGPDQYPMTLQGLKDWSLAYVNMFPEYKFFTANCQKYNIGVYNAVTHSQEAGDQEFWSNVINPLAKIAGNVMGHDITEDPNPECQPGGVQQGAPAGQR